MQKFPNAIVQVTGGGTGTGISALINGTTDICQASRKMKEKEQKLMTEKHGGAAFEIEVARDGLAIYVNNANKIEEISFAQLKDIFKGKTTNWKDVGGADSPIIVYSRENSSGTYEFFKETVLGGDDFAATAQTMPGTAAVVNAVSKEANGIGYGGAAYGTGIRSLKVKKEPTGVAVAPTEATVKDGSYPLARPLQIYLRKAPEGELKAFTDWIKGPEGQKLVTEVGYYPI
jgi:phosphate transport system substrate-binding protein